jgi:hypothetical protein
VEETDGLDKNKDSDSEAEINEDEQIRLEAARLKGPSSDAIAKFENYREYIPPFLSQC